MKHKPMNQNELVEVLKDILLVVDNNDSFEGSIEYLMPDPNGPDCDFMVRASYRVGNSMGQGGVVLIGELGE